YDLPGKNGFAQMLKGWSINSIFTAQSGTPLFYYDSTNDVSGTGNFNDHWNITGDPRNLDWNHNKPIPFYGIEDFNTVVDPADPDPINKPTMFHAVSGTSPEAQRCYDQAFALGGQAGADQLIDGEDEDTIFGGCFVSGNTVVTPPAPGTFGNMKRNVAY